LTEEKRKNEGGKNGRQIKRNEPKQTEGKEEKAEYKMYMQVMQDGNNKKRIWGHIPVRVIILCSPLFRLLILQWSERK
jgi:hypothetical protein